MGLPGEFEGCQKGVAATRRVWGLPRGCKGCQEDVVAARRV